MGRHPKSYERHLTMVREMEPGTTLVIKQKKPWGLTHKIYAMLKEWLLTDYYTIRTDKAAGTITIKMEGGVTFVYDED